MKIRLNENEIALEGQISAFELRDRLFKDADMVILDGFALSEDMELYEGCRVVMFRKGMMPHEGELEHLLVSRHSPDVHRKIKEATVGIAGLGGLGSNIAAAICRLGIGKLVIADFDTVEPSNLNRQNYFVNHIGMKKTDATSQILMQINPYVSIETHDVRLDETSTVEIFKEVDVFIEALDKPSEKAKIINSVLANLPEIPVVAASGMAGYETGNIILTRKRTEKLYVCGDGESAAMPGRGLMSPRVMITAGHQANTALRLLLGETDQ